MDKRRGMLEARGEEEEGVGEGEEEEDRALGRKVNCEKSYFLGYKTRSCYYVLEMCHF